MAVINPNAFVGPPPEPHPTPDTGSDVWIAQFNERMALRSRDAAREAASGAEAVTTPSQPRAVRPSPVRPVPTPAAVARAATPPPVTPTGGGLGPLFVNPDHQ